MKRVQIDYDVTRYGEEDKRSPLETAVAKLEAGGVGDVHLGPAEAAAVVGEMERLRWQIIAIVAAVVEEAG